MQPGYAELSPTIPSLSFQKVIFYFKIFCFKTLPQPVISGSQLSSQAMSEAEIRRFVVPCQPRKKSSGDLI
jgi:hypothetical protein